VAPELAVLFVLGLAGLPVLAARALGGPAARSTTEVWAARCAVAFLVVIAIGAALAPTAEISFVGAYEQGTGWIFYALLAGCFGLGTGIGAARRGRLELALIAGACVNALVALGQQFIGLSGIGLGGLSGQSDGLLGNPVFFGAFMAAALVLVAPRFLDEPGRWWPVPAGIAIALGVSGERMPALLALVVGLGVVVVALRDWRAGRRTGDQNAGAAVLTWPIVYAAGIPISMVVGSLLARIDGGLGVIAHTANSGGGETYQDRFVAWSAGLRAFTSKPVVGYGPGQFRAATSHLFTLHQVVANGGSTFADAHNVVVEVLVTTGLVGAALFFGWIGLGALHRKGALLGFAAVLLASELVEPLDTVITPLVFLALGAAVLTTHVDEGAVTTTSGRSARKLPPGTLPTWVRPASAVAAALALLPALWLTIGDLYLQQARLSDGRGNEPVAVSQAKVADTLLFAWPDPSWQLGMSEEAIAVTTSDPSAYRAAIDAERVAVSRDSTNATLWVDLAQFEGASGDQAAAEASAQQALRYQPFDTAALNFAAFAAMERGDTSTAERYFTTSLAVNKDQAGAQQILQHLRRGCRVAPVTEANPNISFNCPTSEG